MKTAYLVEVRYGTPVVTEFRYEKKTAALYLGCKAVGYIVGRGHYLSSRIPHESVREDLGDALQLTAARMREGIERCKRDLNAMRSRLGEVEKVAKTLNVSLEVPNEQ